MRRRDTGGFDAAPSGGQRAWPGNLAAPQPANVAAVLQQGLAFHQAGQLAEAEVVYRQILGTAPERFDVWILLAFVHFQRADYHGALRHIDRALKLRPDSAEGLFNRGLALHKLERFGEALASY